MAIEQKVSIPSLPIDRRPVRTGRRGLQKRTLAVALGTAVAVGGLAGIWAQRNQQTTGPEATPPIGGGIVIPGPNESIDISLPTPLESNNPSPTPTETPAETKTPTPTETLAPTLTELILTNAEFNENGEVKSKNGELSFNYSQDMLDTAGISKITGSSKATDTAHDLLVRDIYKAAGKSQGKSIKLGTAYELGHENATSVRIKGVVNNIKQYIVTAEELINIQKGLQNAEFAYQELKEWPAVNDVMGYMYFDKDGTLVTVVRPVGNESENLRFPPDNWNGKDASFRVTFAGPGIAYFYLTMGASLAQGNGTTDLVPDPIYKAYGCNESNDFCRIGQSSKMKVSLKND